MAGLPDDEQRLCVALALWNGRDPILQERLFGLANSQGHHGEDVKEVCFYLDSTPTHACMKQLYEHPQGPCPDGNVMETKRRRSRADFEDDLLDTGVFSDDRCREIAGRVGLGEPAPRDPARYPHRWAFSTGLSR